MLSKRFLHQFTPVIICVAAFAILFTFPLNSALAFTGIIQDEEICFSSLQGTAVPAAFEEKVQQREADYRAAHKYLGYATLVMGGLAAISASSHSLHRAASYAAVGLGAGTVATGFKEYGGYIDLSDGFSSYDIHAVLGTAGLLAFTAAVAAAEADSSHSGFGVGSAVSMGISVIAIKW